jgi:hypothetical protein
MNQQPSSNSSEKSVADHPFFLPYYDVFGDYNSEMLEDEHDDSDRKSEKGDWDSFGDLILFI